MKTQTIHVHAWETVNAYLKHPRRVIEPGVGGFDWYVDKAEPSARRAFKDGIAAVHKSDPVNTADFLFEVQVPASLEGEKVTEFIDSDLHDYCAKAKIRRVGANVLEYWRRNKFRMGGAKRPSTAKQEVTQ